MGKSLIWIGAVIFVIGVLMTYSDRLPFLKSIGRLPGDFHWKGEGWQVHFPFATSILLSLLLTLAFWLWSWLSSRGHR